MKVAEAGTAQRSYRMVARARSTAATKERILDAAVEAFWESPAAGLSLDDVARGAGVSLQTVIRHFGGKEGLLAAAVEREHNRVREARDRAQSDDLVSTVRVLVDHYEELGDRVVRMLAEEQRVPGLAGIAESGRRLHREWCRRVFASSLAGRSGAAKQRRLAQLVAICDVYTWKVLRRDSGLSRRQTELALIELLEPLLEQA
jgi:AcrR family transcriptional regulator